MTAHPSKASDIPTVGGIDPKTIRLVLTRAKKKWSGKLTAQGTLNKKTINYSGALEKARGGKVAYDLVLLTKLTLADIMGGLKVPGLNKIEIDRLEKTDKWMEAGLKIHGKAVTAVVFKPKGASKNHIAVLPASFKIADFTPLPSGTPLDKVTFQDMAFLYVPKGQGKTGVSTSGLQADVAKALAHSGTKVDLKDGLNLFGKADFAASGTVKSLLSALGVTKTNLALNGSLPNDLFSHDPKKATKKIKDKLLDALHLEFPLPALKPRGLPASVSFTDGHLAIDGIKEGKGGVEVGIDGTLSASLGSKKISFAVTAEAEKTKGSKADYTISGKSTETPTLSFVHALKLTSLTFNAARKGGKWAYSIDAKTTLAKKPLDVETQSDVDRLRAVEHEHAGDIYLIYSAVIQRKHVASTFPYSIKKLKGPL